MGRKRRLARRRVDSPGLPSRRDAGGSRVAEGLGRAREGGANDRDWARVRNRGAPCLRRSARRRYCGAAARRARPEPALALRRRRASAPRRGRLLRAGRIPPTGLGVRATGLPRGGPQLPPSSRRREPPLRRRLPRPLVPRTAARPEQRRLPRRLPAARRGEGGLVLRVEPRLAARGGLSSGRPPPVGGASNLPAFRPKVVRAFRAVLKAAGAPAVIGRLTPPVADPRAQQYAP